MNGKKSFEVKCISEIVGEWGKWQRDLTIFVFLMQAINAYNDLSYSFHSYPTDFWCTDSQNYRKNETKINKCFKSGNESESCDKWSYDSLQFNKTINSQFDLVCDRLKYASITQCCYMFGFLITGLVLSQFADKYGRKPIVWVSSVIVILALIACGLANNVIIYSFSRFVLGLSVYGCSGAMCTSLLESCGPKHRSDIYMLSGFGWVFGYVLVPGMAYWLKDYQLMSYYAIIPVALTMVWFYFIPESPRWLITNGQVDRAEQTLRDILKRNQLSDEHFDQKFLELKNHLLRHKVLEESKSYSVFDLLRTSNIRKYSLIFWFSWMVLGLVYYGFSLNMSDFGGNFYITFLLSGLVELPSTFISLLTLRYLTRRKQIILFQMIIALSSLAIIPTSDETLKVMFALIGKFAVGSLWWGYEVYVPEVYPTVLRNTGSGLASSFSRLGSMASPFMGVLAAETSLSVVMILYATLSLIAAVLVLFLPETKGTEIPDTLDEIEDKEEITKSVI